jgi:cytochrome P450
MELRAAIDTVRWLVFDQRRLIEERFGDSDEFAIDLMLPIYAGKQLRRKLEIRKRRVVFVRGADSFAQIYRSSSDEINTGSAYAFLKPYFGDESVFVMEGQTHVPAKQAVYRVIQENMEINGDDLLFFHYSIKEVIGTGTYPILPEVQYISSAFVIRTLFGAQGTKIADSTIRAAIAAAGGASGTFLLLPNILRWTRRFGTGLAMRRQRLALRNFVLDQINRISVAHNWRSDDNSNGQNPRTQIIDNLMTLLIAGFETTAATICWLLFELARSQELQSELRAEIMDRFRPDPLNYLADDTSLLGLCTQETLRLHPSIPFVIREAQKDIVLRQESVRAGDYIVLSIEELHKRAFGDDGEVFRPDRFREKAKYPKIATFGGGAKICPGRAIAVQQVRTMCALLLSSFLFELSSHTDHRIQRNRVSSTPRGGMVLSVQRIM